MTALADTYPRPTRNEQMKMTMDQLVRLDTEYERAQAAADDANARRNEAVLVLIDCGTRQSDVAEALDISPGRVSQIVRDARRRRDGIVEQAGVAA